VLTSDITWKEFIANYEEKWRNGTEDAWNIFYWLFKGDALTLGKYIYDKNGQRHTIPIDKEERNDRFQKTMTILWINRRKKPAIFCSIKKYASEVFKTVRVGRQSKKEKEYMELAETKKETSRKEKRGTVEDDYSKVIDWLIFAIDLLNELKKEVESNDLLPKEMKKVFFSCVDLLIEDYEKIKGFPGASTIGIIKPADHKKLVAKRLDKSYDAVRRALQRAKHTLEDKAMEKQGLQHASGITKLQEAINNIPDFKKLCLSGGNDE